MSIDSNISNQFLNICQKGQELKLQDFFNNSNDNIDWTLYRHGASGDTGLHLASRNGHVNIVKLLCKYCTNPKSVVNVINLDGKRPLHDAAQFSRVEIVKFLINQGAFVNTFKRADWTPLMLACTKEGLEAKACINLLLEANADPFLKNKDGWTAFFIACRTGDYDIVNLLLNRFGSKSIENKSNNGRTVLHICAFHGHLKIIEFLLQKYAYLLETKDSSGCTPLHESIKSKHLKVTKKLIELGADVLKVDNSGYTILHMAVLCQNVDVLEYVMKNELINVNLKDLFGNTAYDIAEKNKLQNIVDIFMVLKNETFLKYKS